MAGRARLREALGRLALVLFGLVLGIVALEACLQLGALYVAATRSSDGPHAGAGAAVRVMCLGDSNTYGLYFGKEHAYPRALEEYWNAANATRIEVINLGFPGNNSSVLRNRLPDALRLYHPAVVTIMIGVNDIWSAPETLQIETYRDTLWRVSRLYRLLALIARSWEAAPADRMPGIDGEGIYRPTTTPDKAWKDDLRDNLIAMSTTIAAAGARPVLLTYPGNFGLYRQANDVTRATAAKTRTLLIDLSPYFGPACSDPSRGCALLVPDLHPTKQGHQLAGNELAVWLRHQNVIPASAVVPGGP